MITLDGELFGPSYIDVPCVLTPCLLNALSWTLDSGSNLVGRQNETLKIAPAATPNLSLNKNHTAQPTVSVAGCAENLMLKCLWSCYPPLCHHC
jgi:hypothetical protein